MNGDWLTTARQTLPRLKVLSRALEPTYRLRDARDVSPEFARQEAIRAVVWDVDGTLMAYHAPRVDPRFDPVLRALESVGVVQAVLSNCGEERFLELGKIFPESPVVRAYDLRGERSYRILFRGEDSLGAETARELLAAGARQVRKPDGDLLLQALQALGGIPPESALMVGDQFLTDVATANLAGVRSAKVPAWAKETFPLPIRFSQWLEGVFFRLTRRRGRARSS